MADPEMRNKTSYFDALTLEGFELVDIRPGFLLFRFVVPSQLTDEGGNWSVGAITASMDCVGSAAVLSSGSEAYQSIDLNASFYSTAKIQMSKWQEEVEVEAKVVDTERKLKSAVIEIRKKESEELIAKGRLWMSPINLNPTKKLPQLSSRL